MRVFPNPFLIEIKLTVSSEKNQLVNIRLVDDVGRIVKVQNTTLRAGTSDISLSGLDNLNKGLYILEVEMDGRKSVYRVVK